MTPISVIDRDSSKLSNLRSASRTLENTYQGPFGIFKEQKHRPSYNQAEK
jgi:hypothetical protein